MLAIAQPALAADVVDRWLEDFEIGAPSILASSFWEQAVRPAGPTNVDLNIGWRAGSSPGVALVTKVPADSAAHGLLRPNDRVIGVNGRLLSLASSSADLDAQLSSLTTDSKLTLRVQRGDTMADVTVPLDTAGRTVAQPPVSPADAVGEFASLGRALRFATLTVHATDETQYSAKLSIRLAPDNSP